MTLAAPGGAAVVTGLVAQVRVTGGEAANDSVAVATFGGADTVTTGASACPAPAAFDVDGGDDSRHRRRTTARRPADTIAVVANGTEVSTRLRRRRGPVDTTAREPVVLGLGGDDTHRRRSATSRR